MKKCFKIGISHRIKIPVFDYLFYKKKCYWFQLTLIESGPIIPTYHSELSQAVVLSAVGAWRQ